MFRSNINCVDVNCSLQEAFKQFTYFKKLSENCLNKLYNMSLLKCFYKDEIILGLGEGFSDHVYFVVSGECVTIEILHRPNIKKHVKMQRRKKVNKQNNNEKEYFPAFAQICFFLQGATFNIGKELESRCVVARSTEVWCLLVPRERLLLQHNTDNVWTRLSMLLQDRMPKSQSELLTNLNKARQWDKMRRQIVLDTVARAKCSLQ